MEKEGTLHKCINRRPRTTWPNIPHSIYPMGEKATEILKHIMEASSRTEI